VPRIHFQQQLAELKDKLLAMAALAQQAVESALEAYLRRDKGLCKFVKQNERAIDTRSASWTRWPTSCSPRNSRWPSI